MPDLHIHRHHHLGLAQARKIALRWADQAASDFDMTCTYQEGKAHDVVSFTCSGVDGSLTVTADDFELKAKLGFLLGAFKGRIEKEIVGHLDDLLAKKPPAKAAPKESTAKTPAAKKAPARKTGKS